MLNDTRDPQRTDRGAVGRWGVIRAIVLGLLLALAISAVLLIDFLPSNRVILEQGEVSPTAILAPYELTYESEIRTRQAQDARAASVQEIYDDPDVLVVRQQENRARHILDYLTTVREDPYAGESQKLAWIGAIPDVDLSPTVITTALALDKEGWLAVKDETVRVLERAMQGEIREGGESRVRRTLPTYISRDVTDREASVVEAIAGSLVTANTFYNAARTEEARQQARAAIDPIPVTIQKGEAIVRAGSRVTAVDIEALDAYGLRQQAVRWQSILSVLLLALVASTVLEMFTFRLYPGLWARWRAPAVTFALVALFVLLGKLMLPFGDTVIPYLYPLPALSMLLTILFGPALGVTAGVVVALLGAYVAGGSLELTLYLVVGTLVGPLALGRGERLKAFFWAGIAVALANAAVLFISNLQAIETDLLWTSINALVGVVMGGLAASLTLAAFLALSTMLDIVTPFQLMELARPTHPLLRQLLLNAPGTYHHTILVSNMAEAAAERIGADGLLTRVGTYYHDIGKTARPYFFTENRVGGVNPHERLDPRTSAQIILGHVHDGLDLAHKYKLPAAVRAFIPEHHGTGIALAFYRMAVSQAGDGGNSVDKDDFRYDGPKPQSRETAITMLADSCEARVRSAEPKSLEEMDRIIGEAIKSRLDEGQLDDADLTLRDIQEIHAAFLNVLKGMFHPRVKYPEPVKVRGPDGQEVEV
ncbi:MAG TPA: HDIG domain-containing protein [Anaerolineae bacterium]|nr:HDIG domain-containing protein [Anaerolineae bacterium]